jgi:preprotein translocase subunit SecF
VIDLVGRRRFYYIVSILTMVPGIISLAIFQLRPGIEFTSGSSFTLQFAEPNRVSQDALAAEIDAMGYNDPRVQSVTGEPGTYIIRTRVLEGTTQRPDVGPAPPSELEQIEAGLRAAFGELTRQDFSSVSAIVSERIVRNAALAVVVASLAILLYISWAFRSANHPFRYGTCAIIAMLHDVVVVVGTFSLLGEIFGFEVNTMFITGLLTIIGFSVHDTIVVFDRIRENQRRSFGIPFAEIVNNSLNETIGRSLNTSMTVLFTLWALLLIGGVTIRSFIVVLLIGIISGTYSSIAIASQLLVTWDEGTFGRFFGRLKFWGRREPAAVPQVSTEG